MMKEAQRVGVIDVGSNSTRLLVADVVDGRVTPIERRSTVTRLGRGVDLSGQLAAEAIEAACAAVDPYVATLQEMGAERRERVALSARVLYGEEEACLTYLGATSEHSPEVPTLVVDIGGGSTELIVGEGREIEWHTSLQAGVVRHTERHLVSDPPTPVELEALAADLRGLIEAATAEI